MLLFNGKHIIINVSSRLNRLGMQLSIDTGSDSNSAHILLLLLDSHSLVKLSQLQLKVGLGLADHLRFELELFILGCEVFDVVLHLLVLKLGNPTRVHLATLSKLLKVSLKLDTVLTQISYQSLELFNFRIFVHVVDGATYHILDELFVTILLNVGLEVLHRRLCHFLRVNEVEV